MDILGVPVFVLAYSLVGLQIKNVFCTTGAGDRTASETVQW